MLDNTIASYITIRSCILLFRIITPISVLVLVSLPLFSFLRLPQLPTLVIAYALSETLFYFLFFLPRKHHLQSSAIHPPVLPLKDRRILFDRCAKSIPDIEPYLRRWFLNAPSQEIKRENVKDFYTWALLNDEPEMAEEGELDEYVDRLEVIMGQRFEKGRGRAECLKLTVDKVDMVHRPLFWYMIVSGVDLFTHMSLLIRGFSYYRSSISRLSSFTSVFPFRPQALLARNKSPNPLSYWYKPHTSTTKKPILFLHGIGIGLFPYDEFLSRLNEGDEGVGILAVEILPVSFRITKEELARERTCEYVNGIVEHYGWDQFVVVSHSYGTIVTTHLLHSPLLKSKIASIVLIDPVSILLHLPDVAYNFIRRQPHTAAEHQLWFFACKDMGVAHTLSRRFFWADNVLWLEDLANRNAPITVSVFLAGRDLIVDTAAVAKYLTDGKVFETEATEEGGDDDDDDYNQVNGYSVSWKVNDGRKENVKRAWSGREGWRVYWCDGLDHAQVFDKSKGWFEKLIGEVRDRSAGR